MNKENLMKRKMWSIGMTILLVLAVFLNGTHAQAGIQPIMAIDGLCEALNAGEVDVAVASFANTAIVENKVRSELYRGTNEIRQMLLAMQHVGRHYDIVSVEMHGNTLTATIEVADRGIAWATETVAAEVRDGKLQTFQVIGFRLNLWG
jgi:hypothetical protein